MGLQLNIKKLRIYLSNIGNDMETSGLLLVSVFCNIQRTHFWGAKIRHFSKSRIACKEKIMEIRTFCIYIHA